MYTMHQFRFCFTKRAIHGNLKNRSVLQKIYKWFIVIVVSDLRNVIWKYYKRRLRLNAALETLKV